MLLFVLVLATLASIVSGILPALQSARLDVSTILKDESHGVSSLRAGRMSRAIVVAESATSSALLLAAGFLTTSIIRLNSVDPGFATRDVLTGRITLSGGAGDTAAQPRFFEAFDRAAALTPGLAAIGLYASIAFSVSRRVREMGIRMALGAARGDVVRLVCWQGAKQILLGVGIGLMAGAALVSLMRVVLFGVEPGDPGVIALVLGVLGAAGFVACIVPALRATRVDPLVALRAE